MHCTSETKCPDLSVILKCLTIYNHVNLSRPIYTTSGRLNEHIVKYSMSLVLKIASALALLHVRKPQHLNCLKKGA